MTSMSKKKGTFIFKILSNWRLLLATVAVRPAGTFIYVIMLHKPIIFWGFH